MRRPPDSTRSRSRRDYGGLGSVRMTRGESHRMYYGIQTAGNRIYGERAIVGRIGLFFPCNLILHHAPAIEVRSASTEVITPKLSITGPTPCTQGQDAFHFVVLKSLRGLELSVGSFAASKQMKEERRVEGLIDQSWKYIPLVRPQSYGHIQWQKCLELESGCTPNKKITQVCHSLCHMLL